MNAPERKVVYLAFCLFAIGVLVRLLPWGLPTIESVQIEDAVPVLEKRPAEVVMGPEVADTAVLDKITAAQEPQELGKRRSSHAKKKKTVTLPLGINAASAEELCALNGVGPKLADKIVAHRQSFGPFKSPKDLEKVPGIGKKKLENMLPGIIFD